MLNSQMLTFMWPSVQTNWDWGMEVQIVYKRAYVESHMNAPTWDTATERKKRVVGVYALNWFLHLNSCFTVVTRLDFE